MDITGLILDDHHEQRRLFAILEQIDRHDAPSLVPIWSRLASFLEVHAAAEEAHFYPQLLQLGKGAGGQHTPEAETKDAIKDHNEIRDAVAAVAELAPASDEWFAAIAKANKANGDHMAEEEREGLTDVRLHVSLDIRHELAVAFAAFEAAHITGVRAVDKDPDQYIAENRYGD
jgi:hypothetical protein